MMHILATQFRDTAVNAVKKSIETGRAYRVFQDGDGFYISDKWADDWLFVAYPGGRKIVSPKGRPFWGSGE